MAALNVGHSIAAPSGANAAAAAAITNVFIILACWRENENESKISHGRWAECSRRNFQTKRSWNAEQRFVCAASGCGEPNYQYEYEPATHRPSTMDEWGVPNIGSATSDSLLANCADVVAPSIILHHASCIITTNPSPPFLPPDAQQLKTVAQHPAGIICATWWTTIKLLQDTAQQQKKTQRSNRRRRRSRGRRRSVGSWPPWPSRWPSNERTNELSPPTNERQPAADELPTHSTLPTDCLASSSSCSSLPSHAVHIPDSTSRQS